MGGNGGNVRGVGGRERQREKRVDFGFLGKGETRGERVDKYDMRSDISIDCLVEGGFDGKKRKAKKH